MKKVENKKTALREDRLPTTLITLVFTSEGKRNERKFETFALLTYPF